MTRYSYRRFESPTPPELAGRPGRRWPVAIVGAGPIGLTAAVDLALHGIECVVLDDNDVVSVGSRAICWSKRTLEIFDRLGVGRRMVDKGITWKVGRLFHRDREVYAFDLLPESGYQMPAFINLQQYYVEEYLAARCEELSDRIELRWNNRVTGLEPSAEGVRLSVDTPDGGYQLAADWLIACDGSRSFVREAMGLDFAGRLFEERFLIADVEMKADFPNERWFWFEPPFHPGDTALLHKQPDDIYRIDLQLGWNADPEEEKKPENVVPRIERAVEGRPFELDWVSVYTFQCRRLERFVHGRVIFAGDSAHVVSPFGARGGNGGIQDVDNLVWKLAAVIRSEAPAALLATYDAERIHGADENIMHSSRSTRFMSPHNRVERLFRDEVLALADHDDLAFARRFVNSGRLSTPCTYAGMAHIAPDDPIFAGGLAPGEPCLDAPADGGWLLDRLGGDFRVMGVGVDPPEVAGLDSFTVPAEGHIGERYGRGVYLVRPDQHVAARWVHPRPAGIASARDRALGAAG